MAISIGELIATIDADVRGLEQGLQQAGRGIDQAERKLGSITDSTLSWQAALGVLAGATGLALAARKVFDLGAATEETASKFRTVFGPATASVQAFIDNFATMAGLTETNARNVVATPGAIVQGMGFAQDASAKLAEQVVRLAADFSSFNNVPIEETSRAIQAALTGERGGEKGCQGWLCDCSLVVTDQRRSPKVFETLINIVNK